MSGLWAGALLGFLAGAGATIAGVIWWAIATDPAEPDHQSAEPAETYDLAEDW